MPGGVDVAARGEVAADATLQLGDLGAEEVGGGGQLGVLPLERLHLLLQPGDALQLPPAALGGGDAVSQPLALCLQPLLALRVQRRQRRRRRRAAATLPARRRRHLGHRLRLLQGPRRRQPAAPQTRGPEGQARRRWRGGGGGIGAARGAQRPRGVEAAQVGVDGRRVGGGSCRGSRWPRAGGAAGSRRGERRRRRQELVLLVQVSQGLDEAVGETLLFLRHRLPVEERPRRRRRPAAPRPGRRRPRAARAQPRAPLDQQLLQVGGRWQLQQRQLRSRPQRGLRAAAGRRRPAAAPRLRRARGGRRGGGGRRRQQAQSRRAAAGAGRRAKGEGPRERRGGGSRQVPLLPGAQQQLLPRRRIGSRSAGGTETRQRHEVGQQLQSFLGVERRLHLHGGSPATPAAHAAALAGRRRLRRGAGRAGRLLRRAGRPRLAAGTEPPPGAAGPAPRPGPTARPAVAASLLPPPPVPPARSFPRPPGLRGTASRWGVRGEPALLLPLGNSPRECGVEKRAVLGPSSGNGGVFSGPSLRPGDRESSGRKRARASRGGCSGRCWCVMDGHRIEQVSRTNDSQQHGAGKFYGKYLAIRKPHAN